MSIRARVIQSGFGAGYTLIQEVPNDHVLFPILVLCWKKKPLLVIVNAKAHKASGVLVASGNTTSILQEKDPGNLNIPSVRLYLQPQNCRAKTDRTLSV